MFKKFNLFHSVIQREKKKELHFLKVSLKTKVSFKLLVSEINFLQGFAFFFFKSCFEQFHHAAS